MDATKIKTNFEEIRSKILEQIKSGDYEDDEQRLRMALFCYITIQHNYAQLLLPEDQRFNDEEKNNLTDVVLILTQHPKDIMNDFQSMLDQSETRDYYMGFVFPVLMQFDIESEDKSGDGSYVNLNNKNMRDYLAAALSVCFYVAYMDLSADDVISLLENDTIGEFTHNATDPSNAYKWIREEFNIPASDISAFWDMAEQSRSQMSNDKYEQAKEALAGLDGMMEKAMPMFCGTTLSGCKEDEQQKAFRTRLDEMIHDEQYHEGLSSLFSVGMVFLAIVPESFDVPKRLSTHEKCVDFFDSWYNAMAGSAIKDFYEPLNDYDKNVARTCFLGGFLTGWTSSQVNKDGLGFLGLHAGAAYNLPNDIK